MKPITQMKKWTQILIALGIIELLGFLLSLGKESPSYTMFGSAILFGVLAWYIETRK